MPRSMTMHLRENRTIRATVARKDGNMLGVRFELADSKERRRMLQWVHSILVDIVQAPPSPGRLVARFAARCLK